MENKPLQEMTDMELVERHEQIGYEIEHLDAEDKVLRNDEFLVRLKKIGLNSKVVGDFNVTKNKKVTFPKTTLEIARELGAIKEVVDTKKLKGLVDGGAKIDGTEVSEYVTISRKREKKNGQS